MRYSSVNDFKGKKYVNIREFYSKEDKLLPGKKGIHFNNFMLYFHILYCFL
jgi:hypothetical protein